MGNYTEMFFHFVWATKRRQPFITSDVETVLFDHIRAKCHEQRAFVYALNGMSDHVHLVCGLPTTVSIGDFIGKIKGTSAHAINRKASRQGDLQMCLYWQPGFGILTLTQEVLPRVVAYVENQKQRHATGRLSARLERCDDGYPTRPDAPEGATTEE